ncbi:hypothetical protein AWENTII_012469 [Aspergillus wentii]
MTNPVRARADGVGWIGVPGGSSVGKIQVVRSKKWQIGASRLGTKDSPSAQYIASSQPVDRGWVGPKAHQAAPANAPRCAGVPLLAGAPTMERT